MNVNENDKTELPKWVKYILSCAAKDERKERNT